MERARLSILKKLPRVSALDPFDAGHPLPFLEVSALLWEARSLAPITFQCFLFKFLPVLCFGFCFLRCFSSVLQLYFQLHINPLPLAPSQAEPGPNSEALVPSYFSGRCRYSLPLSSPGIQAPHILSPSCLSKPLTEEGMILPWRLC